MKYLTRIAPTPSGFLHPGNLYNILLTQKVAVNYHAEIFLRIDDLDSARNRPEYLSYIFDSLHALNVKWDKGPKDVEDFHKNWAQHYRMESYNLYLKKLAESGLVYPCKCSRKDISDRGAQIYDGYCKNLDNSLDDLDVNWRIKVPESTVVKWQDEILGEVSVNLGYDVGDFVIRRRGVLPAYQLSSLVDDYYMGVNLIVRGDDLIQSTAMQLYLANVFQITAFSNVKWWHHPLLLNASGEKMSKSSRNTPEAGKIWKLEELIGYFKMHGLPFN